VYSSACQAVAKNTSAAVLSLALSGLDADLPCIIRFFFLAVDFFWLNQEKFIRGLALRYQARVTVCVCILLLLFILLLLLLLRGLALRYQARVTVCVCDLKYSTFVCPGVQQARADAAGSGTPPDQYLSPSTIRCRC